MYIESSHVTPEFSCGAANAIYAAGKERMRGSVIADQTFANRSQAIQAAVAEKLARLARSRLAREAAKLDPQAEKTLAEEGLLTDARAWAEY